MPLTVVWGGEVGYTTTTIWARFRELVQLGAHIDYEAVAGLCREISLGARTGIRLQSTCMHPHAPPCTFGAAWPGLVASSAVTRQGHTTVTSTE